MEVNFETAAETYPKLLNNFQPDFILNTGLSASSGVLRLEKFAINSGHDHAASRGKHFGISSHSPDGLSTRLNLNELAAVLNAQGIPALRSDYAGSYLCNFVYYHSLFWCSNNRGKALFVHMPFTTEIAANLCLKTHRAYASLPQQLIEKALNEIIMFCIKPNFAS